MTREQFLENYRINSLMANDEFNEFMEDMICQPCECGENFCMGWELRRKNK